MNSSLCSRQTLPDDSMLDVSRVSDEDTLARLLYGTLHKLCIRQLRQTNQMPIVDPTHRCTQSCDVRPVTGRCYRFAPDRVHICYSGCTAPPNAHAGAVQKLEHVLYVCTASGQPHLCTPEWCKADKVEHEDNLVCTLTGRCFDGVEYSSGWMQDMLDRGLLHRQHADKNKRSAPDTDKDEIVERVRQIVAGAFGLDRLRPAAYAQCIAHAYKIIRDLMPHSHPRSEYDHLTRVNNVKRLTALAHKFTRSAKQQGCIDWTALRVAVHNEIDHSEESGVHADSCTFDLVARAHARKICHYLFTVLLQHTQLHEHRVNFCSCVVVLLYMQRGSFRVHDKCVVSVDYSLYHLLPNLVTLQAYPDLATLDYTTTKTAIQANIIQAIERERVDPARFTYHPLQTSDLLWV